MRSSYGVAAGHRRKIAAAREVSRYQICARIPPPEKGYREKVAARLARISLCSDQFQCLSCLLTSGPRVSGKQMPMREKPAALLSSVALYSQRSSSCLRMWDTGLETFFSGFVVLSEQ